MNGSGLRSARRRAAQATLHTYDATGTDIGTPGLRPDGDSGAALPRESGGAAADVDAGALDGAAAQPGVAGGARGGDPASWTGITPPTTRGRSQRRIGEVIVDLGFAPREVVEQAVEAARASGEPTGKVLVERGVLTPDQLARAVAERYGLDHLDLRIFRVDMGALNLVSPASARRYEAVPVAFVDERTVLLAMADPANVLAVDDIAMMTGFEVRRAVTSREDIEALIAQLSRAEAAVEEAVADTADEPIDLGSLHESAEDAPIVKLVHSVIADAVAQGASDIHFDPEGRDMRVRFRIDGVVTDSTTVPRSMVAGVVSRIKIMADLDIAETRRPQDGRVSLSVEGRQIDLRVVTLPTFRGESVVARILDKSSVAMDLEQLGMGGLERERFREAISRTHGAVLVTGPTGSGKTTTLYAALTETNTPDKTLITIEDPVEYQLDGVKQVQVNPKIGLDFAAGLRAMLRADPNVIMVGEVRDRETAQIAVEAALTGHLVLSTLHTNDAPSAVTRLVEMGVEPFLVASAVDCVVAQRLARTLCAQCRQPIELSADALRRSGFDVPYGISAYEPGGCVRCGGTGYKGRVGLYQVMRVTRELRELILERGSADAIAELAAAQGMRTLRADGLEKVQAGLTSISEVARVTAGWTD
ncbi:MAG: Flp pilus assembly complex ATPase component TadA [Thermoleophilaceae bacterium]|nr:Flp pilus assembly complex ATPase component TadA [Thermoleophilaceae bacterium]